MSIQLTTPTYVIADGFDYIVTSKQDTDLVELQYVGHARKTEEEDFPGHFPTLYIGDATETDEDGDLVDDDGSIVDVCYDLHGKDVEIYEHDFIAYASEYDG